MNLTNPIPDTRLLEDPNDIYLLQDGVYEDDYNEFDEIEFFELLDKDKDMEED